MDDFDCGLVGGWVGGWGEERVGLLVISTGEENKRERNFDGEEKVKESEVNTKN